MDTTASARVPVEVKRQGDAVLRGLGSSPTELINAAYAYVIECGSLPRPPRAKPTDTRGLSKARQAELRSFLERSSASAPDAFWRDFTSYGDLLQEGRTADYEALG